MSDSIAIPDLQRPVFFDGQLLTADDLNTAQTVGREMRWLHNRSLHDWGIVTGLAVSGAKGARSVTVAPGLAIDSYGREIILTQSLVLAIPVIEGTGKEVMFYLITGYQGDAREKVVESRDGVCSAGGAVRLGNDPRVEWRTPVQLRQGIDVILATVWIQNCGLSRRASNSGRRSAKPSQQPYVASGQTDPQSTPWTAWVAGKWFLGFTVEVDTSAAHFHETPQYIAQIAGQPFLASKPGPLLAVAFTSVVNAQADRFTLHAMLPASSGGNVPVNPPELRSAAKGPGILQSLGWHIVWTGIEG